MATCVGASAIIVHKYRAVDQGVGFRLQRLYPQSSRPNNGHNGSCIVYTTIHERTVESSYPFEQL